MFQGQVPARASGGAGATYALGGDGGGGGGGYYGGGGGGAGFLIVGGGGGGGGINWSQSWTDLNGTAATFTNGTAPAGTKNGSASLSVTTESNNAVTTTYITGCAGTTPTASEHRCSTRRHKCNVDLGDRPTGRRRRWRRSGAARKVDAALQRAWWDRGLS